MADVDVLIAGAGITGLVAAYRLQQAGKTVRVVEANTRVGGRTYTMTFTNTNGVNHFDYGAHFIGHETFQAPIWDLVKELGLEVFPQYEGPENVAPPPYWAGEGANLQYFGHQKKTYAYIGGTIPETPAGQFYLYYLDQLASGVRVDAPELTDNADNLDSLSVWDWVSDVNLPGYGPAPDEFKSLTRMLCRVGFSTEPENISMLWLLFYVASSGGLARFQDLRWPLQGAQGYRLKKGAQSIAEALKDKILANDPNALMLFHAVNDIDNAQIPVKVQVIDNNTSGVKYVTADRVLVAMAPAVFEGMSITKPNPALKGIGQAMENSHMIMTFVTFKTAFWRTDTTSYTSGKVNGVPTSNISRYGLSGDVLLADEDVVWIMDNTSAEGTPALFAFIVGDAAKKWSKSTAAKRRGMVLGYMRQMFGAQVDAEVTNYYEHDWNQDMLSKGCPAGHFTKGQFLKYAEGFLLNKAKPYGGVYVASTETALLSNGYMSGAAWSGETVSRHILADLGGTGATPGDPTVRAQAMAFCVNRVIQAVQMKNPGLEQSVITQTCAFTPPGGKALSNPAGGDFTGMAGTVAFYVQLGSLANITRFEVLTSTIDVANNMAYARVSISGTANMTGSSFVDLEGTMAFFFNDPTEAEVLIAKDMLLMDTNIADEVLLGLPPATAAAIGENESESGGGSGAGAGASAGALTLEAMLEGLDLGEFDLAGASGPPDIDAKTVIFGPGGSAAPRGPYFGKKGWAQITTHGIAQIVSSVQRLGHVYDPAQKSVYVLYQIKGLGAQSGNPFDQPLAVTVQLSNGAGTYVERVQLQTDGVALV